MRFTKAAYCLLLFCLFHAFVMKAQDRQRLRKAVAALVNAKEDTNKVVNLDLVAWDTSYDNLALGLSYSEKSLELAEKLHYEDGIIHACNTQGTIYTDMGDLNKALTLHLRGLGMAEKAKRVRAMGTSELNISIVYTHMKEYDKALEYLLRAKKHYEAIDYRAGVAVVCNDLGGCYMDFKDSTEQALANFRMALEIGTQEKRPTTVANSLGGIAKCYHLKGDSVRADQSMQRAIAIMDSIDNNYEMSMLIVNYAWILSDRGHYRRAESYLLRALDIYRSIGMREQEVELWQGLADIYEKTGQLKESIAAWKNFSSLKDSVMNENVFRKQRELEAVYENEKRENEIKNLRQEKQITELDLAKRTAEKERLTGFVSLGGIALLLVLGFAAFIFYSLQQKKKANAELGKAYAVIEETNKNITDSINYARKIQEAVLPPEENLKKQFADAFVFYRPRDIVSGDFWWCTEKDGHFILAAADCTGHGVPGGFMSVMSAAFLSEIINEKGITNPAEVLSLLRLKVIYALKQTQETVESNPARQQGEVKDGMDIAFCSFTGNRMEFACANNPVWIVRNNTLIEFEPDRFPVGIHYGELLPFTKQESALEKGDMVYLFSDGYADQFGGKQGKKFKYRQLKDLVVSIANLSCEEQNRKIRNSFDSWKGNLEQVDDVLVIGIKI